MGNNKSHNIKPVPGTQLKKNTSYSSLSDISSPTIHNHKGGKYRPLEGDDYINPVSRRLQHSENAKHNVNSEPKTVEKDLRHWSHVGGNSQYMLYCCPYKKTYDNTSTGMGTNRSIDPLYCNTLSTRSLNDSYYIGNPMGQNSNDTIPNYNATAYENYSHGKLHCYTSGGENYNNRFIQTSTDARPREASKLNSENGSYNTTSENATYSTSLQNLCENGSYKTSIPNSHSPGKGTTRSVDRLYSNTLSSQSPSGQNSKASKASEACKPNREHCGYDTFIATFGEVSDDKRHMSPICKHGSCDTFIPNCGRSHQSCDHLYSNTLSAPLGQNHKASKASDACKPKNKHCGYNTSIPTFGEVSNGNRQFKPNHKNGSYDTFISNCDQPNDGFGPNYDNTTYKTSISDTHTAGCRYNYLTCKPICDYHHCATSAETSGKDNGGNINPRYCGTAVQHPGNGYIKAYDNLTFIPHRTNAVTPLVVSLYGLYKLNTNLLQLAVVFQQNVTTPLLPQIKLGELLDQAPICVISNNKDILCEMDTTYGGYRFKTGPSQIEVIEMNRLPVSPCVKFYLDPIGNNSDFSCDQHSVFRVNIYQNGLLLKSLFDESNTLHTISDGEMSQTTPTKPQDTMIAAYL